MIVILLCIVSVDSRRAEAYSVKLQEDGIYAEVLPDSVVNNAAVFFEKSVKKTMKYYKKYKDADTYTLLTKVPDEYRDFIPVARKIQSSDKIIIKNPFFIYNIEGDFAYKYYFTAKINKEKLCLFSIDIDPNTGKVSFGYDKLMDQYFLYNEKVMVDALFYKIDNTTYAQTPEETNIVRELKKLRRKWKGAIQTKRQKKSLKRKIMRQKRRRFLPI